MITKDYNSCDIPTENLDDIRAIADVKISELTFEDCPNLLIFPDSFESCAGDIGKKVVCSVNSEDKKLHTNSIVRFFVSHPLLSLDISLDIFRLYFTSRNVVIFL